jgi:GNAT superfamily N-acetyltransferase
MLLLRRLEQNDPSFYPIMGPIFGSRLIAREVGINIYDDDDKQWFIAEEQAGMFMAGCISVRGGLVSDCYVYPRCRRQGALRALLTFATLEPRNYRANCTAMSLGAFLEQGFKPVRVTKNFTYVEKKNA